jgi:hypothetical protein
VPQNCGIMNSSPFAAFRAAAERKYWADSGQVWARWEKQIIRRAQRRPFDSFPRQEVERIAKWKNREPLYGLVEAQVRRNNPKTVREVTAVAFAESDPSRAIEILASTRKLHGVDYPVASAILTFHDPKRYTVFDKNVWRALYYLQRMQTSKSPPCSGRVYARYLSKCQAISKDWGLGLRETDRLLWVLGG